METENGKIENAVTRLPNLEVNFGAEKFIINFVMKLKLTLCLVSIA